METKQQSVTAVADDQIVRYLLHQMEAEERSGLEDRLVREPSFFEVIAATEDDMIMRYVRGDLDTRLLPRFEEIYLHSSSKRARVEQARLFQQAVRDAARTEKPSLLAQWFASPASRLRLVVYSAALAAVILSAVLLPRWISYPSPQPPQRLSSLRVSLDPGRVRSGAGVQIHLPAGTKQVEFQLALPPSASGESYRALLQTPERPQIWNGPAARKGQAVVVTVPADRLAAGDYTLELQVNDAGVADYYFRVLQ